MSISFSPHRQTKIDSVLFDDFLTKLSPTLNVFLSVLKTLVEVLEISIEKLTCKLDPEI